MFVLEQLLQTQTHPRQLCMFYILHSLNAPSFPFPANLKLPESHEEEEETRAYPCGKSEEDTTHISSSQDVSCRGKKGTPLEEEEMRNRWI